MEQFQWELNSQSTVRVDLRHFQIHAPFKDSILKSTLKTRQNTKRAEDPRSRTLVPAQKGGGENL